MSSTAPLDIPGQHGPFIQRQLPDWLKHSTPEDFARLGLHLRPEQLSAAGTAGWFERADQAQRQTLLNYQAQRLRSARQLARTLADFKGLSEFAEPLLNRQLYLDLGVELDVNHNSFVEIHRKGGVLNPLVRIQPREQSLMQAALQNYANGSTFEPGSALAPSNAFGLELIPGTETGYPRFRYRFSQKFDNIEPEDFAQMCHRLDLGGKYQAHLAEVFDAPLTRQQVREQSITVHKDILRVDAQVALMKADVSEKAHTLITALLSGEQDLQWDGQPIQVCQVSMFGKALSDVLLIGRARSSEQDGPVMLYLPGAPHSPLKEYVSYAALLEGLALQLRKPAYRTLLRNYVAHAEQAHVFSRLEETLYQWVTKANGMYEQQFNPNPSLYLSEVRIDEEVFGYQQDRHLQKLKAQARVLAVPSAEADEQAREARLQYWENIGLNLLNAAAFCVPALGTVMAVVTAVQLVEEVVEGITDWTHGDLAQAWGHFESVALNVALAAGLGMAGRTVGPVPESALMDDLVPVRLRTGDSRLWKADLSAYAASVEPSAAEPDAQGLYQQDDKQYLRIDERMHEVQQDAQGQWRICHPTDADGYQPLLMHNGQGAWRVEGEYPLEWSRQQLLRRIGPQTDGLDDVNLHDAADISAIDDDVLRRVHLGQHPVPPLLLDTLQRLRINRRLQRLIDTLQSGQRIEHYSELSATAAVQLPNWPQRIIEVFEADDFVGPSLRYGEERWADNEVIRVRARDLPDNHLVQGILAHLSEDEVTALLGEGVADEARVLRLRSVLAEQVSVQRQSLFEALYTAAQPNVSEEAVGIQRQFPLLPAALAEELAEATAANRHEYPMLVAGRTPLRLAQEARLYQRQVRVSRALEGLCEPALGSLHSDQLAVRLMATLPGWPATLRLELHSATFDGELLASAGEQAGMQRVVVRSAQGYSVYNADGIELSESPSIFQAILMALPAEEREVMDLPLQYPQALGRQLYSQALGHRAQVTEWLGLQPVRPGFRSPLRLADGRVGYPLGGTSSRLQRGITRRLSALYPRMSPRRMQELQSSLIRTHASLGAAVLALENEFSSFEQAMHFWVNDVPTSRPERSLRMTVAQHLKDCWQRLGPTWGRHLDLSSIPVSGLPTLAARFDHVELLNLSFMGLPQIPDMFLSAFSRVTTLNLESNELTAIPEQIASLPRLRVLDVENNRLLSSPTLLNPLRGLQGLRSLNLGRNGLNVLADEAAEVLAELHQLQGLDLHANGLHLQPRALAAIASMPLRALDLGENRVVLDEAGAQLLSGLTQLEHLTLSRNPAVALLDVSAMRRLQYLDMQECALTEWPLGLTTLMSEAPCELLNVDLSENAIEDIPPLSHTLFAVSLRARGQVRRHLHMEHNPLNPESEQRLLEIGQRHVRAVNAAADNVWLSGASEAQRELWEQLFNEPARAKLQSMLQLLAISRDFQVNEHGLRTRVWDLLGLAGEQADLRDELVAIADNFPVTCGDAGADAFSELEVAAMVFRRSQYALDMPSQTARLLQLYSQLFRRAEVQRLADLIALGRTSRQLAMRDRLPLPDLSPLDDMSDDRLRDAFIDGIEIRLALQQDLAASLNYPEPSENMLYRHVSGVTPQTAERVRSAVLEQETAERRQEWMVRNPNWQRFLKQQHGEDFNNLTQFWAEGLDYLDYCAGISDSRVKALEPPVQEVLQDALNERLEGEQNTLRKLPLNDQQYRAGADALQHAHLLAETELMLSLTRAQELIALN